MIGPALAAALVLGLSVSPVPAAPAPRGAAGVGALVAEAIPPGTEHNAPYARQGAVALRIPEGIGLQTAGTVNTFTGSAAVPGYRLAVGPLWGLGLVPRPAVVHNANDPTDGPLGPGWTHNLAMRLHDAGDGSGAVVLVGPQGRRERFRPAGGRDVRDGPEPYGAARGGGRRVRGAAGGRVGVAVRRGGPPGARDRRGGARPGAVLRRVGRLAVAGDPDGGADVAYEYDWCFPGRLCAVVELFPPNNRAEFGYDPAGRLERISNPLGTSFAYGYDGDSHRLAWARGVDGGVTLELAYDAQGRVQTARDIDDVVVGWRKVFAYQALPDGTRATVVARERVDDPASRQPVREDTYAADGRILVARAYDTRGFGGYRQVESVYDAAGNLKEERISTGP